jgi:hypothetical protein
MQTPSLSIVFGERIAIFVSKGQISWSGIVSILCRLLGNIPDYELIPLIFCAFGRFGPRHLFDRGGGSRRPTAVYGFAVSRFRFKPF